MARYLIFTLLLAWSSPGTGLAQAPAFTLRVDVPVVSVDVSVTYPDGKPVTTLTPADFEILDNGVPRPLRYFGASTAPYHAFLLIDVSGSARHKWDFMRRAVETFVAALQPKDRVRLGLFGEDLKFLGGWSEPGTPVLAGLDSGFDPDDPGRTTEFFWALEQVLENGFEGIAARRAIVVLTDGRDLGTYQNLVRTNRLTALEDDDAFLAVYGRAARSGTAVYIVALNTDLNLDINQDGADEYERLGVLFGDSPIPERYLEHVRLRMESVAAVSGGRVYYPRSPADVAAPFGEIASSLGGAYSLGYDPPSDGDAGAPRRIEVLVRPAGLVVTQSRDSYRVGPR